MRTAFLFLALGAALLPRPARAEVPVQTTLHLLPSSNGHGAIMVDLKSARLVHFREHVFAAEEPLLDQNGMEVWNGNQPQAVATRDLLYDAYFGLRANGKQAWLTGDPVDLDQSGYFGYTSGVDAGVPGTGIARMVQKRGDLLITQYFFCPQALDRAGFVMALRIKNDGATPATGVSIFSLHNFHLGYGRPGVLQKIAANGETGGVVGGNLVERGFAGVIVAVPFAPPLASRRAVSWAAAPAAQNLFDIVDQSSADYPDSPNGDAPARDDTITGFQWDFGDLPPGQERWIGVAFAHDPDPLAAAAASQALAAYLNNPVADQLVSAETYRWTKAQGQLRMPAGLSAGDETLLRQSAVMLDMAQVADDHAFLREFLEKDGQPRYTRFGATLGAPPATLPATIAHRGHGAILASLPPGEWTVAWVRDGAYSIAALSALGQFDRAKDALSFFLDAEAGRFQSWNELKPYDMPPYKLSLVRYQGFGVEETDENDFGPNLEFDGAGLFLWALHQYQRASGDASFVKDNWPVVKSQVADVIAALIEPAGSDFSDLLRADSSIWETHWNGRQRHWTFTDIAAARGLCDAADLAQAAGDAESAAKYRAAGIALRQAIAHKLTDASGALGSNREDLVAGSGYWDAAVLDGIALGLFDPQGRIAKATLAGIDAHLRVPAGAGWARNDDRTDGSPWGSDYDSGEWVFVDMRGAAALSLMGQAERAARLTNWVRDQALGNFLEIGEVFDEGSGVYKFNSPMIGFGAGAYALALAMRGAAADPACGAYFAEQGGAGGGGGAGGAATAVSQPSGQSGCGCRLAEPEPNVGQAWLLALASLVLARRRWRARRAANRAS